jgi:tight adherence protein C
MDARTLACVSLGAGVAFCAALVLTGRSPSREERGSLRLEVLRRARAWALSNAFLRDLRERGELRARRLACLREMPDLLDVLTLGLSSGLSFDASLELYCERRDDELAHAFGEALLSWRVGAESRPEALSRLAGELDAAALRSFAATVSQALEFGSPLADALERQSQAIRDEQRSQVEEAIEKVPVKMLVPLGTLVVPAMLLAILGPLVGSSNLFG